MDFKAEYKKSAEIMTPSPEAMERMKNNILAQTVNAPAKKPIPLKRVSMIGGAVAACAVISVSAVTLLPMTKTPDSMVANGTGSHAMSSDNNMNSIADRNLESEANKEEIHNSSINAPIADEDGNTGGMDNVSDAPQTDLSNETCDICCDTTEPANETADGSNETGEAIGDTGEAIGETGGAIGETGEATDETGEAIGETGGAIGDTGEAMDETGEAMDETGEAIGETGGAIGDTGEAMDETGEAMDETGEAMDETGEAMDETGEAM
ncbi:MAG: hypothetical protein IJZ95_07570, partial [Oscillospiraceae bacterium]|nr:hypothetical protein [Oscillospiraceae bacterium]